MASFTDRSFPFLQREVMGCSRAGGFPCPFVPARQGQGGKPRGHDGSVTQDDGRFVALADEGDDAAQIDESVFFKRQEQGKGLQAGKMSMLTEQLYQKPGLGDGIDFSETLGLNVLSIWLNRCFVRKFKAI
jgi:hypothetical protein